MAKSYSVLRSFGKMHPSYLFWPTQENPLGAKHVPPAGAGRAFGGRLRAAVELCLSSQSSRREPPWVPRALLAFSSSSFYFIFLGRAPCGLVLKGNHKKEQKTILWVLLILGHIYMGLIKRSVIHDMTIGWKTTQKMIFQPRTGTNYPYRVPGILINPHMNIRMNTHRWPTHQSPWENIVQGDAESPVAGLGQCQTKTQLQRSR